jgi:hypothetical protein
LTSNGLVAWAEVLKACFEGYVAKDESSAYEGGRRGGGSRSTVQARGEPADLGQSAVLMVVPYLATISPLILS